MGNHVSPTNAPSCNVTRSWPRSISNLHPRRHQQISGNCGRKGTAHAMGTQHKTKRVIPFPQLQTFHPPTHGVAQDDNNTHPRLRGVQTPTKTNGQLNTRISSYNYTQPNATSPSSNTPSARPRIPHRNEKSSFPEIGSEKTRCKPDHARTSKKPNLRLATHTGNTTRLLASSAHSVPHGRNMPSHQRPSPRTRTERNDDFLRRQDKRVQKDTISPRHNRHSTHTGTERPSLSQPVDDVAVQNEAGRQIIRTATSSTGCSNPATKIPRLTLRGQEYQERNSHSAPKSRVPEKTDLDSIQDHAQAFPQKGTSGCDVNQIYANATQFNGRRTGNPEGYISNRNRMKRAKLVNLIWEGRKPTLRQATTLSDLSR